MLGEAFQKEPEKIRKHLVQELVKNYSTAQSAADANPKEPHYRDRLNVVAGSMKKALELLTDVVEPGHVVTWPVQVR